MKQQTERVYCLSALYLHATLMKNNLEEGFVLIFQGLPHHSLKSTPALFLKLTKWGGGTLLSAEVNK